MRVRWNSNALRELAETLDYLHQHNRQAATAFAARVEAAAKLISEFPMIGGETSLRNVRRVIVGGYILVYEVKGNEAVISYIRHGARKRPWEND
jgi:addiction module RelE/StbE family toxin